MVPRLCSAGSIAVGHRPRYSETHGILLDQGSNPCLLHWQADSLPLNHQGSPSHYLFAAPLQSPPRPSHWLGGAQGVPRAGSQGPGHHGTRTLPLTDALRHGWTAAQECFIYLCQKSGGSVPPLLIPLEAGCGSCVESRLCGPWPSPVPWAGQREVHQDMDTSKDRQILQQNSPEFSSTRLLYTHSPKRMLWSMSAGSPVQAHLHRLTCTHPLSHKQRHTHFHTFPNPHVAPCAHVALYLPTKVQIFISIQ